MGFFDSLGIQFIDDVEDDVEDLLDDKPEEKEEHKVQPKAKTGSRISDYSKEDLIVFLMVLVLGAAGGFGYAKLLHRKEPSQPFYQPQEVHHHHYPDRQVEEKPKHHTLEKEPPKPKKGSTRYGYYLDENFDAVLDSPRVQEQWIVEKDFNGDIIDVKKIPDMDQVL